MNQYINEDQLINWIKETGGVLYTHKINNINDINLAECKENTIVCLTGYNHIIENFFNNKINLLKKKIILVTLETDNLDIKLSQVNHPLVKHWFTWNKPYQHEKITCLPIGLNYDRQQNSLTKFLDFKTNFKIKEKKLLCLNGSLNTNNTRQILYNKVINEWNRFCDIIENVPFIKEYFQQSFVDGQIKIMVTDPESYYKIFNYKFILSPEGAGFDCHRTWEALYLDIIPIVLSSSINEIYEELPILVVNDWNEINENYLNDKYIEISLKKKRGEYKIEKMYLNYWINKINSYKNMEEIIKPIHFITYANHVFEKAKIRLLNQAKDFYSFKTIGGYGPEDLPIDFTKQFNNILNMPRGAGYWIWRPILLKKKLDEMNENEFLIYLDAGCHLNKHGMNRFKEYIDLLDKSEYGILSFQLSHLEKCWTTKEIFNYFNINPESEIGNSGQYVGGVLVLKKNKHLMDLLDLMIKSIYDFPMMFTDHYNNQLQHKEFKENRHDQSVISILRKLYGSVVINKDESYFVPFGEGESLKYPFWATRSRI